MAKKNETVLVVAGRDILNINLAVGFILKNINPSIISIITNDVGEVKKSISSDFYSNVNIIHEQDILPKISHDKMHAIKLMGFPGRYFWYYQQFLKMLYSQYTTSDEYLIWDADTIPLRELDFNNGNVVYFTKGFESLHKDYHSNFSHLTGLEPCIDFSLIAQHMLINSHLMRNLIELIENRAGKSFQDAVLDNLFGSSLSLFSEYETYGNYFISSGLKYEVIQRNWFRFGTSLLGFSPTANKLEELGKYYDYIALEKTDFGFHRKVRANLLHFGNVIKYPHVDV